MSYGYSFNYSCSYGYGNCNGQPYFGAGWSGYGSHGAYGPAFAGYNGQLGSGSWNDGDMLIDLFDMYGDSEDDRPPRRPRRRPRRQPSRVPWHPSFDLAAEEEF